MGHSPFDGWQYTLRTYTLTRTLHGVRAGTGLINFASKTPYTITLTMDIRELKFPSDDELVSCSLY